MADDAFKKAELVLNATYALEAKEELIMAAVYHSPIIETPAEDATVYYKDAETILALLKAAGKVSDAMVSEMEEQIDKLNEGIEYTYEVTRKVYTWPPSEDDKKKLVKQESKTAGVMDWIKGVWTGLKKFIGLADKYEDTINQVIELAEANS